MLIECQYNFKTSYLIATVMFASSDTILEIFAVEMCMILALTFRMDQGQMKKIGNRTSFVDIHMFAKIGCSNVKCETAILNSLYCIC